MHLHLDTFLGSIYKVSESRYFFGQYLLSSVSRYFLGCIYFQYLNLHIQFKCVCFQIFFSFVFLKYILTTRYCICIQIQFERILNRPGRYCESSPLMMHFIKKLLRYSCEAKSFSPRCRPSVFFIFERLREYVPKLLSKIQIAFLSSSIFQSFFAS